MLEIDDIEPGYIVYKKHLIKLPEELLKERRSIKEHYSNIRGVNSYKYRVTIPKNYIDKVIDQFPKKLQKELDLNSDLVCVLYRKWYKTIMILDELDIPINDNLYDFRGYRNYHLFYKTYKKGEISYLAYYLLYKPKEIGVNDYILVDKSVKIVNLISEIKRLNSSYDEDKINRAFKNNKQRIYVSFFGRETSYTNKKGLQNSGLKVVRLKYYLLKRRLIREYQPTTDSLSLFKSKLLSHYNKIIDSILNDKEQK